MKIVQEPNYEVEAELLTRLKDKYEGYEPECVEFSVGDNRLQIESTVIEKCLKRTEEQATNRLKEACEIFDQVCADFSIPRKTVSIRVLADEKLKTAVHVMAQVDGDEKPWGLIFLPSKGMHLRFESLLFIFLHELGHCWLDVPFPGVEKEISNYEMFVNVTAMSTLRRLLPSEEPSAEKKYRDVVDVSYVAAPEMTRVLGYKVQRHIINKPESFLKLIWTQDEKNESNEKSPSKNSEVSE